MKSPKKYFKLLLSKPLRLTFALLYVPCGMLRKRSVCPRQTFCVRLIHFFTQQQQKLNRHQFFKVLFLASIGICLLFGQVVSAQTQNASVLVEQGIKYYDAGNFPQAVKHWQEALHQYKNNPSATAVVNENLARAYQQIGENKAAIASLEAAIRDYGAVENIQQVGRMKSELAQVYSNLGQPRKAIALLCGQLVDKSQSYENQPSQEIKCTPESAQQIATKYNDKRGQVAALGILGEAYRLIGSYDQAIKYLDIAQFVTPEYKFLVLNSLGNAYKSRGQLRELQADSAMKAGISSKEQELTQKSLDDYSRAYQYFQDSIKFAHNEKQALAEMRGLLNLIQLASQTNKSKFINDEEFNKTLKYALKVLKDLPDSATKVYGEIDLASLQRDAKGTSPFIYCPTGLILSGDNEALNLLENSVLTSKRLQDNRLISYANGALGHFWECRKDNEKALKYTQSAIIAADRKLSAKDSLYLWEWQAGRILDEQNRKQEAIASYQRAFDTLEDIRQDILTAERDVQFDFRDVVRPLYRTLAQSRLDLLGVGAITDERRAKELSKVVNTIDALKLAELQNYFGNDCILSGLNPKPVGELLEDNSVAFKNTGFLSSIILNGKTGILLQLPNQASTFKWIEDPNQQGTNKIVSNDTLQKKIAEFRKGLISKEEINYDTTIAAQLYDWMIRPFAEDIKPEKVKTLVFIQDGFLRSVPMAALYDSQQKKYLVETYAVATTPSLRITKPKLRERSTQKALILGLTQKATIEGKTFDQLFAVPNEVNAVESIFPNHTPLLDDNFIPKNFQQKLDQTKYPIVHIASHAQFGIIPEDTFIVTGKNQKLTISQLETSLQNFNNKSDSVELLTLTACETAVGDDRATLGLAGVALQVGVKSAIASLWSVTDQSTSELVKTFYTNYRNPGMSIAQALQTAQIRMINAKKLPPSEDINPMYDHPAYWAPMIAIGNWL